SLIQPLPLAYRDRLARLPAIEDVSFANWFGGVYQDERNFFPQFALEAESWRRIYPEFEVPEEEWRAFLADRQGAIAGRATAERFGWKVGDRIPIRGSVFSGTWEFNLRGVYRGRRPQDDETQFWFHRKYFEEKGPEWLRGIVGWYVVRIARPDDAVRVAKAVDEAFANSPWETRTQTERAFAAAFVNQMGNIEFLILAIGSVVFFTLLLVTGNTMAIAVRERTGELAVLKAVGFSDGSVLLLVLAESLLVALLGGGLGLGLAAYLVGGGDLTGGIILLYLPGSALAAGILTALLVGLLAGLLPAVSAMRLSVVEALRRI
ncbi:MAG TPA: FtsX-like permease family protein, partial [Vicinamibacteria bacterium]|nr:FtsX-like permease family protein [Vicinamibacteria bacterium]